MVMWLTKLLGNLFWRSAWGLHLLAFSNQGCCSPIKNLQASYDSKGNPEGGHISGTLGASEAFWLLGSYNTTNSMSYIGQGYLG